jgi:hypothetical protein
VSQPEKVPDFVIEHTLQITDVVRGRAVDRSDHEILVAGIELNVRVEDRSGIDICRYCRQCDRAHAKAGRILEVILEEDEIHVGVGLAAIVLDGVARDLALAQAYQGWGVTASTSHAAPSAKARCHDFGDGIGVDPTRARAVPLYGIGDTTVGPVDRDPAFEAARLAILRASDVVA